MPLLLLFITIIIVVVSVNSFLLWYQMLVTGKFFLRFVLPSLAPTLAKLQIDNVIGYKDNSARVVIVVLVILWCFSDKGSAI